MYKRQGLFLLLFFYSASSKLKSKYLDIKNSFSNTNEYLAVVNDDGLWIKEEIDENLYIIHAKKYDESTLKFLQLLRQVNIIITKALSLPILQTYLQKIGSLVKF